jgi:2'-5' RNA ligase
MARLFVAVTPPSEAVEALREAITRGRAVAPELRWINPEGIHLTLAFLGSVDDELRDGLAERLGRVARRHPPVPVTLARPGRFADRVLWAGVAGDLEPLAAGVRRAAQRAGVEGLEDRPLVAHLTLARGQGRRGGGAGADLGAALAAVGELPEIAWTVFTFELMSSVLGQRRHYAVEASWDLVGRE